MSLASAALPVLLSVCLSVLLDGWLPLPLASYQPPPPRYAGAWLAGAAAARALRDPLLPSPLIQTPKHTSAGTWLANDAAAHLLRTLRHPHTSPA